jgi:hypothetical protein
MASVGKKEVMTAEKTERSSECGSRWVVGGTEREEGYLDGFIVDKKRMISLRRIISGTCGKFTTLSYIKRIEFVLNLFFDKSYSRH